MSQIAVNESTTMPQNGWQLFLSLVKSLHQPESAWKNPVYRRKFLLRTLINPVTTSRLLSTLACQPMLTQLLHVQPGLPCRLHRLYLSANFNRKDTLNALCFHYQMLDYSVPKNQLRQHFSPHGARLVSMTGKDEVFYSIDFCAIADLDKEGEATLVMKNEEGRVLADYDTFRESLNGKKRPEGYFLMPSLVHRNSLEEIASKKRAEYRRRYTLLDSMVEQINSQL